jgi:hypothetical protein
MNTRVSAVLDAMRFGGMTVTSVSRNRNWVDPGVPTEQSGELAETDHGYHERARPAQVPQAAIVRP